MTIKELEAIVNESDNIVFFGGAGVSTESGIPDFKSAAGLYKNENYLSYSPEYMLSYTFFKNHPEKFYEFYKSKMLYPSAKPNKAHISLAKLEEKGKLQAIITQNIDNLHQLAGSKNVIELHGSAYRNYCMKCGKKYSMDFIIDSINVPLCTECSGMVRPDIVLYEEGLKMNILDKALYYIQESDVLIVGGTSLSVYPATGLINYYKGKKLILINKSETSLDKGAYLTFNDSIGEVLNQLGNY